MHKIHLIAWVWISIVLSAMATDSFIVLSHGDKEHLVQQQSLYDHQLQCFHPASLLIQA